MKLVDYLKQRLETEPDFSERILKIGSASAFFYGGRAADFIENVDAFDRLAERYFTECLETATELFNIALRNPPTLSNYAKEVILSQFNEDTEESEPEEFSLEEFQNRILKWFDSCRRKRLATDKSRERRDGFKPFSEREVLDNRMCDPVADDGAETIITEGFEPGGIWMTSEYEGEYLFSLGRFNSSGDGEDEGED